ncbi:MAG TPA: LuxR family transcriptional regulator [Candidatus Rubneribacter avistercoris]|nr:LuxR family transcriptional regulator [Candidatus Rubneribacter avistercoris]
MARTSTKTTGIDRFAAMLEPAFPLRMLGFGLIYAWSTCIWDLPLLGAFANGRPLQGDAAWVLSAAITPLACIVGSLVGRTRELAAVRSMFVLGPVLTAAGTLFAVACPYLGGVLQTASVVLAGVGTGVGPVVLILLWACLFARTETGIVETVVPASFVATLLCALAIPSFPPAASVAVVTALPLASGALLLLSKRALDTGSVPREDLGGDVRMGVKRANIARMFLVIFAVYAIGCLLPAASNLEVTAAAETAATIVGMVFAVALSAAIVLFSRRINLEALFRWITVPFVFAIICTALGTLETLALSRVLANVVFTGIEIIMVLYFVRLAQKTGRTSTFFVGIGECAAYAGVLVGYVAQPPIEALLVGGVVDAKTFCLLLVGVFVVVTLLVPRRDATLDAAGADADAETRSPAEPHAAATATAQAAETTAQRRARIARSYGLSNRETEVFLLLAQGRSRPYIRDALILSKNTVATHIRHIYEKLGIHSQQELIDLAEDEPASRL